ncbi:MAG: AAA family ATPase [Defluviitaleaceae bacterium]|nr:AAA family ATPase [Defluviitaleaceae bacterium]
MYSFDKVLGNDHIKDNLRSVLSSGRVSHAFIFSGQVGTGKKLIAYTFAKALACSKINSPCGQCISCQTFESGNNPDIISVRPAGKSIGVDEVREQIALKMRSKPYSGKYKIFVIENADKLTVAAQNALLKTIEEPEDYGIFLLVCKNYNLFLPTIISRAIVLNVHPLPSDIILSYLIKNNIASEEEGEIFASYSEGSIGKAAALAADEEFKDLRTNFLKILETVENGNAADAIKAAEEMANYKERVKDGLDVMELKYRDALVYKSTERADLLAESFLVKSAKGLAKDKTLMQLTKRLEAVIQAKRELLQNANARLVLEVMLLEIKAC